LLEAGGSGEVPIYVCPICERIIDMEVEETVKVPYMGVNVVVHRRCFLEIEDEELEEILRIRLAVPRRPRRRSGPIFPFGMPGFRPPRRGYRRSRRAPRGRVEIRVSPEEADEAYWRFSEALVRAEKALAKKDMEKFTDALKGVKDNWDLVLYSRGDIMPREYAELFSKVARFALRGEWDKVEEGFSNLRRGLLESED